MPVVIIVVGAGPAGCTAALSAARLPGTHVRVLEKRSLQSLVDISSSTRSYPMVLSGRATSVFDALNLDLPCTRTPYQGITFLPGHSVMKFAGACLLQSESSWSRFSDIVLIYMSESHKTESGFKSSLHLW
jgi:2-polyprenyl-6-methoxyphenol hydroxylase-like FAD-dependent oxidoreductase